jgi:hypothetical protein
LPSGLPRGSVVFEGFVGNLVEDKNLVQSKKKSKKDITQQMVMLLVGTEQN